MRRPPPPARARGRRGARPDGRAAQGADHGGPHRRGIGGGGAPVRDRELRLGHPRAVEGGAGAPREGTGGVPEGDRARHPADGGELRESLHPVGHADFDAGVSQSRRGDEAHRLEGGEAVRGHGGGGAGVHSQGDPAGVLSQFLDSSDGVGSEELSSGHRDDGGAGEQGGMFGRVGTDRGRSQGRFGTVPSHGYGDHPKGVGEFGERRRRRAVGGTSHRRHPLRLPGTGRRRRHRLRRVREGGSGDAGWLRDGGECIGGTVQAVPQADCRNHQVASQQQGRQRAHAGGRSDREDRRGDEGLRGGTADGSFGRGPVRVLGRGVSRRFGIDFGSVTGHCERDWYDEDDSSHSGFVAEAYSHSSQSAREGARELYRFGEILFLCFHCISFSNVC
mmetsp:Transcript_33285/g.56607  ORF Transcript_33285/g.56607 Transcript_33285/m.56607 type:complete len:391 (-) Transcript_33285:739-1911(-)